MTTKNILLVFKKEMVDTIRDRRTLMVMIVLPILLYPVMIIGLSQLTAIQAKKIRSQKMKIGLKSPSIPGDLRRVLLEHEKLTIVDNEWNSFDFLDPSKKSPHLVIGYQNRHLKTFHFQPEKTVYEDYALPDEYGQKTEHPGAILLVRKTKEGVLTFDDEGNMYYWKEQKLLSKTALYGKVKDFQFVPNSEDFYICGYNQQVQKFSWKDGLPYLAQEFYYKTARLLSLVLDQNDVFVGTEKGEVLHLQLKDEALSLVKVIPIEQSVVEEKQDSVGPPKRYNVVYPVSDLAFHNKILYLAYKNQVRAFSLEDPQKYRLNYTFPSEVGRLIVAQEQIFVALSSGKVYWISLNPSKLNQLLITDLHNAIADVHLAEDLLYILAWGATLHVFQVSPPHLVPFLEPIRPTYEMVSFEEQLQLLRKNEIQLVLEIPPAFEKELHLGKEKARLLVHYYGANDQHQTAFGNFEEAIEKYSQNVLTERLLYQLNQDPDVASPVKIYNQNEASPQERGAFHIGKIIAMMIILMTITCPFYPAIDLGAGEKERGTMETLLVSPLDRREIVVGKYLTVVTVSLVAALLNLASMAVTFTYFAQTINGLASSQQIEPHLPDEEQMDMNWKIENRRMEFKITAQQVFVIFCLLLPLTGLFAAASLALSVFAKSYKEGQYYLTPLFAVTTPLAMVGMLPNVELTPVLCAIPVLNVVLLFKELFLGLFIWSHILIALSSTVVFCVIAIYWTVGLFTKEEVLFRESDDVNLKFWIPVGPPRETPIRIQAVFLFLMVMILAFFVGQKLQDPTKGFLGKPLTEPQEIIYKLLKGLVLTQILLIALPTLWLIRSAKMNFKKTLRLNPFKPSAVPLSMILVLACFFINIWIGGVTYKILPDSEVDMKRLEKTLAPVISQTPWILLLLVFGLAPGICEEILFRGFLLSGFSESHKRWQAVLFVGICFGLFHLYPAKYLTTGFMGIILALIVLRTGSIYPAMIAHAFSNSFVILLGQWVDPNSSMGKTINDFLMKYGQGQELLPWYYLLLSVLVAGFCLKWLPSPVLELQGSQGVGEKMEKI